jgi:hypothetical protein
MKTLGAFRASLVSFLSILIATAPAVAVKNVENAKEKSLLRVAEVPAKPDTKKYDLRYKLNRGDVLRYEVTHRASIRTTIDETTQGAQTKTDSVKAWKVTDVLPEGDIEFTNVVEKVHMVNQLPEHDATEYDSTRDKTPPPGFEDAARAVGVPLSMMRVTPQGKVVRRDLKVRNQGAEDDAPIVLRLPEQKVAIGDTWDESFEVQVKLEDKSDKVLQTRRHHKLTDVKTDIATIQITYQVLSPIDAKIETQIVQRLMEGEVKFDIEKGHVVSQQMDIDRRIIGFAGPTSSMQYVMKMEEKLLTDAAKVAAKPKTETKTTTTANNRRPSSSANASKTSKPPAQTANRTRTAPSGSKPMRR